MAKFLLKRLIGSAVVLLLTSLLTFALIYLAPGEPATVILIQRLGRLPNAEEVARLEVEYGLDHSFLSQYFTWTSRALQGDFGYSIRSGAPVIQELRIKVVPTLFLAAATTLFTLLVGIPIGFLAAVRENSIWDQLTRIFALLSVSMPDFWLAFILILIFSISLRWLPTHGLDGAHHLILPVLSLGLANAARLSRFTRSNLLEIKFQNYIQTARAKGLQEWQVWWQHALPNMMIPLLTFTVNQFSAIIAGSVVIETLFAIPGIGQFYVLAIRYNDIPVIQATVLMISSMFILMNLLTDIAYVTFDPRIHLE